MSTPINGIQVECHSALGGDTSIIVGDQIINMRQLHIGYSGQSVNLTQQAIGHVIALSIRKFRVHKHLRHTPKSNACRYD